MIISAVLTISRADRNGNITGRNLLLGILWGALAMFTMAIGIVMIKPLLDRSPLLPLIEIRLFGGGIFIASPEERDRHPTSYPERLDLSSGRLVPRSLPISHTVAGRNEIYSGVHSRGFKPDFKYLYFHLGGDIPEGTDNQTPGGRNYFGSSRGVYSYIWMSSVIYCIYD